MAQEEARALLDTLMGADRNAPLPRGAAIPRQSNRSKRKSSGNGDDEHLWLSASSKRRASCYDSDIDPLYVAWGVDVYELFVNTKSDLGASPFNTQRRLADHDSARQEYLALSQVEKQALGFDHKLFQKLSELVKSCDRIVQRNKEKLHQELQQKRRQKAAATLDYHVEVIDEVQLETLVRNMIQLEKLEKTLDAMIRADLKEMSSLESGMKNKLSDTRKLQQLNEEKPLEADAGDNNFETNELGSTSTQISKGSKVLEQGDSNQMNDSSTDNEQIVEVTAVTNGKAGPSEPLQSTNSAILSLQMELGRLTLQKQKILVDIGYKIQHEFIPLKEAIEKQTNHMQQVKSDTTTDKTVCEVSGNFMSARDADERIAAHYAGKQYVGWKLVRNKFKELLNEYGRNGPPRPLPPVSQPPPGVSQYGPSMKGPGREESYHYHHSGVSGLNRPSGGRFDRGTRPNHDRGGGSGSNFRSGERGNAGGDWRRGKSGTRSPSPPYWERRGSSATDHDRRSSSGGGQRGNWRR